MKNDKQNKEQRINFQEAMDTMNLYWLFIDSRIGIAVRQEEEAYEDYLEYIKLHEGEK